MSADHPPTFAQHVDRLFVVQDEEAARDSAGLPVVPSRWHAVPQEPWDKWAAVPCLVLLADPSLGKSREFEYQRERCRAAGEKVFATNWLDWYSGADLLDLVDDPVAFRGALASGEPLTWFIDALDEGRLRTAEAFELLLASLRRFKGEGRLQALRLRLSCRTGEWRLNDLESLRRLFASSEQDQTAVAAIRLLPLTDDAIRELAGETLTPARVEALMGALRARNLLALASHPLLLALMLEEYRPSSQLGQTRSAVFHDAVERLIREGNTLRLRGNGTDAVTLMQRRQAVEELAARLVLGGHSRLAWPERLKADHILDAEQLSCSPAAVRSALEKALFIRYGDDSYGFFHRSIADYLAARRLADGLKSGWPLGSVLPLFPSDQGGIPSPLRETAAWLAGLSPDFRAWLVRKDPATACLGDTASYAPEDRKLLVQALAESFTGRGWQSEFDRFGDLAATMSPAELQQLLKAHGGAAVRMMVITMAQSSGRSELHELLVDLAMDDAEEQSVRATAVIALGDGGVTKFASRLTALLALDEKRDPGAQIAGAVLLRAFPTHITTAQAMSTLTLALASKASGLFKQFWSHSFLQSIPASRTDRLTALATLRVRLQTVQGDGSESQLSDDALNRHQLSITMAHVFGVFVELVRREAADSRHAVVELGPLVVLATEWANQFGRTDLMAPLDLVYQASVPLRRELLVWWLKDKEALSHVDMWEVPMLGKEAIAEDFGLLADACAAYTSKPVVASALFARLAYLAYELPATGQVERLRGLAFGSRALARDWARARRWSLRKSPVEVSGQHVREIEAQRERHLEARKRAVHDRVERLRAGDIDALLDVCWEFGSAFDQQAAAIALKGASEQYGDSVGVAVNEGLRRAWSTLADASPLWPAATPSAGIVAGLGFQVAVAPDDDLRALSDAQIECVLWLSLQYSGEWFPTFLRAWSARPLVFWNRLRELLQLECDSPNNATDLLWGRLAVIDLLPSDLVKLLLTYAEQSPLPGHSSARRHMFALLWRNRGQVDLAARFLPQLLAEVASNWGGPTEPSAEAEANALSALAMAWLLDPSLIGTYGPAVFTGERHRARVLGFVSALEHIMFPGSLAIAGWGSAVPMEHYAELAPHLFFEGSSVAQQGDPTRLSIPADLVLDARNRLMGHLATAPAQQAQAWFARWRTDARFGNLRDWMSRLHAEATRRVADAQWQPLTREQCDAVLLRKASLVRNMADVVVYLEDLLDNRVAPAFRTDHSLTPLLWGKKGGPRLHEDETALQTALYNAIRTHAKHVPMIGAREPEQFDAKKPDLRLSFVLDTGATVDVPIEIKWSDNAGLWEAPRDQLRGKYMLDPNVRHGLFLVGWAGPNAVARGPKPLPTTPAELQSLLQVVADAATSGTDKSIKVHVVDVSVQV